MPDTQAFSVDWTVTIQPEGDVSDDVAEITIIEERGINSATVKLDASKQPHALEEQRDIHIRLDDGNTVKTFDGFTDSVSDGDTRPIVTVDARTPIGLLDDSTAVGVISEDNLFRVIDALLDTTAGKVRELSFDPSELEAEYGTFAGSTDFGKVDVTHNGKYGVNSDTFDSRETASQDTDAELRIHNYTNNTNTTYQLEIDGNDSDGNLVEATVDLPPADSATAAYGDDTIKLGLTGGNGMFDQVDSITTNIPNVTGSEVISMDANIFNYVKTDWRFQVDSLTSVRSAISSIVRYISGLDSARSWEYYVDDATDELHVQPESTSESAKYVFREGDNVLKPVASRDLDGVRNFIKVVGSNSVNISAWAYNGDYRWTLYPPFESGNYPSGGVKFDSSPGTGQNDIDQINIRAEKLTSPRITDWGQAIDIAKKALREFNRTPVTGQAPVSGLHPATPGDVAEVFYPSRGIPQKVSDNEYGVKKVETRVTPEAAKTVLDFGTSRPNLADQIRAGSTMIRNDISGDIAQMSTTIQATEQSGDESTSEDSFPVVGTLQSQNDDGTWQVEAEDGTTYDNVRVI